MTEAAETAPKPNFSIPNDDLGRTLTVADPDGADVRHISLAGNTYTILIAGVQTNGRYCLIDMHVPAGGGPPPHRHDFEETFVLVNGEIEFTFRGETMTLKAPAAVNVPANAPHRFENKSGQTVRMLCMCTPAGQEEFFAAVGDTVNSRTAPPPKLSKEEEAARRETAEELAPRYRTELLGP